MPLEVELHFLILKEVAFHSLSLQTLRPLEESEHLGGVVG